MNEQKPVQKPEGQNAGRCPFGGDFKLTPETSLTDPEVRAYPTEFYKALREEKGVYYDAKVGMYLVSRYADVQRALTDEEYFSAEMGYQEAYRKVFMDDLKEILIRDGGGFFPDLLMLDPPRHNRPRRLLEQAFTAHRVKSLEPRLRAVCVDVIEKIADKGKIDAVHEFAAPMTTRIICEQLGFDHFDAERVRRWSLAQTAIVSSVSSREQMEVFAKDMAEMQLYLIDRIKERQKQKTEDMLSDLVHARIDDDENPTLSFDEVMGLARPLLVAGHETTATALGSFMYMLATDPERVKELRDNVDDDRFLNRFVEEYLRFEPPVRGLFRMTRKEVELGGEKLPANAHLICLFASANDDETEFPNARTFDAKRANVGRHMSFGQGVHRCIGLSLARMEIKVAAREIVKRLENFKLAIPQEEIQYLPTAATHSIASLPMTITRRTN